MADIQNWSPLELGLALVVLVLLGVVVAMVRAKQRRERIKDDFGPEFTRTVHEVGDERKAESLLAERQKRVASYTIKPLAPDMRHHFVETWRNLQTQFVDDPRYAVSRADDLLGEIMLARGYPMGEFDQRVEDLSVDHPQVIEHYRRGHSIAQMHARGEGTTEDLREAMLHFRSLFDDLVNEPEVRHH